MLKLTIETDNAAFGDEPAYELARILFELSEKVRRGTGGWSLRDVNGNVVGFVEVA